MCQSLAEGGRRCGKQGAGHLPVNPAMVAALAAFEPVETGIPDMPAEWQPKRSWWRGLRAMGAGPLSESDRRLWWYRQEHGYEGPLNQDGRPCRGL